MESKWSHLPTGKTVGKFCHCGEIAFITDVQNNPRPEEPNPCYKHFLEIVEIRKKAYLEAAQNHEN